jgi:hypothetical protein
MDIEVKKNIIKFRCEDCDRSITFRYKYYGERIEVHEVYSNAGYAGLCEHYKIERDATDFLIRKI